MKVETVRTLQFRLSFCQKISQAIIARVQAFYAVLEELFFSKRIQVVSISCNQATRKKEKKNEFKANLEGILAIMKFLSFS